MGIRLHTITVDSWVCGVGCSVAVGPVGTLGGAVLTGVVTSGRRVVASDGFLNLVNYARHIG